MSTLRVTKGNFSSIMADLVTADNTMASTLQALIVFGFAHYNSKAMMVRI